MQANRVIKTLLGSVLLYCAVGLVVFAAVFPVFWMVLTSFRPVVLTLSETPVLLFKPELSHYEYLFSYASNMQYYIGNSVIIATCTTILSVGIGSLAGYALSRFRFRGRNDISFWILSTRMMPPIAIVLPLFVLWGQLGLYDTQLGVIIAHTTFNLPFAVFSLGGFFSQVPEELDEAAIMDGLSRLGAFVKVILPVAIPGVIATALLCFILSWNEFMFALILTGMNARTVTVATTEFLPASGRGTMWGEASAAGTLVMAPVLVFAVLLRKYLVRGLTLGAVKG